MERQPSSRRRAAALLSIIVALPLLGCIYDSDKPCGNGQVLYTAGVERCVCDDHSLWTESGCVPCGVNEAPGQGVCICKKGYGRSSPAEACAACGENQTTDANGACTCADGYGRNSPVEACVACGANESTDATGACACNAGFERPSPQEACIAQTAGPGAPCDTQSSACTDTTYNFCRATEGTQGYCTKQGCTAAADCSTGYSCDLTTSPSFCARPPTGLGKPCTSAADCAGNDATYCDSYKTQSCLVEGCSLSPDNCPIGYECCDLSAYMVPKPLCVSIALGGCQK